MEFFTKAYKIYICFLWLLLRQTDILHRHHDNAAVNFYLDFKCIYQNNFVFYKACHGNVPRWTNYCYGWSKNRVELVRFNTIPVFGGGGGSIGPTYI